MHEFRSAIISGDVKSALDPVARKERCRRGGSGPSLIEIAIPREERRVTNQRREDRYHGVVERATITFRRKKSLVKVVNVSAGGVMIESAILPRIGEEISIELDGIGRIEGAVRWVKQGRVGLDAGEGAIDLSIDLGAAGAGPERGGAAVLVLVPTALKPACLPNTATPAPRTPGLAAAAHHVGSLMQKPMAAAVKSSLSNKYGHRTKERDRLKKRSLSY